MIIFFFIFYLKPKAYQDITKQLTLGGETSLLTALVFNGLLSLTLIGDLSWALLLPGVMTLGGGSTGSSGLSVIILPKSFWASSSLRVIKASFVTFLDISRALASAILSFIVKDCKYSINTSVRCLKFKRVPFFQIYSYNKFK